MHIKQGKRIVACGYIGASLWLSVNTALAVHSLRATVFPPLIAVQGHSASSHFSDTIIESPIISENVSLLRDPFSYHLAADVNTAPNKISLDTSGIRLQGLILARKNGIALQNTQSGAVYFLSEGDEVNGVRVRSITKTGASVNVNGKLMDFPIIEVKK